MNPYLDALRSFITSRGLLGRAAGAGLRYGEVVGSAVPSIGGQSQDPLSGAAINLMEAGGRVTPLIGAALLGVNAGPTASWDTLSGVKKLNVPTK